MSTRKADYTIEIFYNDPNDSQGLFKVVITNERYRRESNGSASFAGSDMVKLLKSAAVWQVEN